MATNQPHLPPTYGELYGPVPGLVQNAVEQASGPFCDRDEARDAILGYRRFLGTVGQHLQLLAGPGVEPGQVTRRAASPLPARLDLTDRLLGFAGTSGTDTGWDHAAARLGVAHDLLATHLTRDGGPRTPDATSLTNPEVSTAAVDRLLADTSDSLQAWRPLIGHATATRGLTGAAKPRGEIYQLSKQIPTLRGLATEILHRRNAADSAALAELDRLQVAAPAPTNEGPRSFTSSLAALRVLTVLSWRQATHSEPANPATLHDLGRLAHHTLDRAATRLPQPASRLDRVRRAAAIDALTDADSAWRAADSAVQPHRLQGTVKAPRIYADAIHALLDHPDPGVDAVVFSALPRLGQHAAETATILAQSGDILTAYKERNDYHPRWRHLTEDETRRIADRYTTAAVTTSTAIAQVNHTQQPTNGPGTCAPTPTRRRQRHHQREGLQR